MAFNETQFPADISLGSRGGPQYQTTILTLYNGETKRNIDWTYPLHKYDISYGIQSREDLYTVLSFFHAQKGEGNAFRYKDWGDYKSVGPTATIGYQDQVIYTGAAGGETQIQLIKTYTVGTLSLVRQIRKPVTGTVRIGVKPAMGSYSELLTGWTVDTTTGVVTFNPALATGDEVSAGYEFDVPVYFDQADLMVEVRNIKTAMSPILLIEDKTQNA